MIRYCIICLFKILRSVDCVFDGVVGGDSGDGIFLFCFVLILSLVERRYFMND